MSPVNTQLACLMPGLLYFKDLLTCFCMLGAFATVVYAVTTIGADRGTLYTAWLITLDRQNSILHGATDLMHFTCIY